MNNAFSWQNFVHFCPASFCTPRLNLPVTPGLSWLPTFAFQAPYWKKKYIFWVLVLEGLVSLHSIVQIQLLQHYWLGHRLVLPWYWIVCLGNEQRSSCHFEIAPKYCISDYFIDYDGNSISSKGFVPTVVDIMVIWINSPILLHFSSLIPKMSVFTLAISCLTTSNLPWFTDLLLFIAPHFTCISSHIHNWALFLIWLQLFILSGVISPFFSNSILGTYWPGEFIFSVIYFCLFIQFMGFSRQEYWSSFPIPSPVDHTLAEFSTMICLSWAALHSMAHSFIELDKAVVHAISLISFCHCIYTIYYIYYIL